MSRRLKSPENRRPRYLQVCDALVAMIRGGEVEVGDLLPTELELCEKFDVSRHTTREALRRVEAMGLVERRRGSGTRVKARFAPMVYNQFVDSLEGLLQYGKISRLVIQQARLRAVPGRLVDELGVKAGEFVPYLNGIRYQRDLDPPLALCLVEIWAPSAADDQVERLLDLNGSERALHELLDFMNLSRISQTLSADSLDQATAERLGAAVDSPALVVIRRYFDRSARLVLLTNSIHPKDRFSYTSEWTACKRA